MLHLPERLANRHHLPHHLLEEREVEGVGAVAEGVVGVGVDLEEERVDPHARSGPGEAGDEPAGDELAGAGASR